MILRHPMVTRTDILFTYTTLFRSVIEALALDIRRIRHAHFQLRREMEQRGEARQDVGIIAASRRFLDDVLETVRCVARTEVEAVRKDRKSTSLNSSH